MVQYTDFFSSTRSGLCQQFDNGAAKKKKEVPQSMVVFAAKPLLSLKKTSFPEFFPLIILM